MPRFDYLFEEVKEARKLPDTAVKVHAGAAAGVTHIIPTVRGRALIVFLKRLNQSYAFPEANQ